MKSKKKIAFVAKDMGTGGVEKALAELSKVLDYENYDISLYLLEKNGEMLSDLDPRMKVRLFTQYGGRALFRRQLRSLDIRPIFYRLAARSHSGDWRKNAWYSAKCFPPEDEVFDCAIAYHGAAPAVTSATLHRLNAKKRILWIHGRHKHPEALWKFFDKAYNRFDLLFGVSQATCDGFAAQFPVSGKKAQVLHNILNEESVRRKAGGPLPEKLEHPALVTVGRLAEEKGQIMVPRTMGLLLEAGFDVHWYLVGDGDIRPQLEEEIQRCGVAHRVHLLGTKENPYPYINNCDIYVQPSFTEGYCTTTTEAKILMKPVVTTDAPGMREQFVSGENGLIVDAMTPEALFQGIRSLLEHPGQQEAFTRALQARSYDNTAELRKLYDFIES